MEHRPFSSVNSTKYQYGRLILCMYICMFVCVHICMYIYIYIYMWYIAIPRLNIVCPPEPRAQIRTNGAEGVNELVNNHDHELTLHQLVGNGK
jgi:hypothetical protein